MQIPDLLLAQFGTIDRQIPLILKGLTYNQLTWQPKPEANSIGFLLWHTLLTWDSYAALALQKDELYSSEGWDKKFGFNTEGRGVEGSGMGTGFTPEDVAIVRPKAEVLLEYHAALSKLSDNYLKNASPESLSQEVIVPWWPAPSSMAGVHNHIITHSFFHLGEAQYVRGLLEAAS